TRADHQRESSVLVHAERPLHSPSRLGRMDELRAVFPRGVRADRRVSARSSDAARKSRAATATLSIHSTMALNGRVGFRRSAHGEQNGLSLSDDAASGGDLNYGLATGANRHDALQALALVFFFFSPFLRGKFGWFGFRRKRVQVV